MLRLELAGIHKEYPGVRANDDVSLQVAPGEIHAVLGENGAGKSTLMKIVYGAVRPDAGSIRWDGTPVGIGSPEHARALGIAMVFQHFSLFDTLSVAENVWLGQPRSQRLSEVTTRIRAVTETYGLELDPERPVHTLSLGERQRVEIVRALLMQPKLLILDEPTSVLTPQAAQKLFATLRELARAGCSILYISHKLDEIRQLCTRCTVMRAGRVTGVLDPRDETEQTLSRLMLGSEPPPLARSRARLGEKALVVAGLEVTSAAPFGTALSDVSFTLHAGEVLGVAGISGNGQAELLAALSGETRSSSVGSIRLFGSDITQESPDGRRRLGLHYVPEDRLGQAAVPSLSLTENTLLTRRESVGRGGVIDRPRLRNLAERVIAAFQVKAMSAAAPAASLSGGNLQKFIVGRELDANPKVLMIAQPTWGVDVGAAAQIRARLLELKQSGSAILVVSEDLDELFEICDSLVVIARGRLSPSVAIDDVSVERIGEWMSGRWAPSNAEAEVA